MVTALLPAVPVAQPYIVLAASQLPVCVETQMP